MSSSSMRFSEVLSITWVKASGYRAFFKKLGISEAVLECLDQKKFHGRGWSDLSLPPSLLLPAIYIIFSFFTSFLLFLPVDGMQKPVS